MAIKWNETLAVGHPEIDKQHQELYQRIDNLLEACNKGKGKEKLSELIDFLGEYVIIHFKTEESIMKQSGYPKYQEHKLAHDNFIARFKELKQQNIEEGGTVTLIVATNHLVIDWLNKHILSVDKEVGRFLQNK